VSEEVRVVTAKEIVDFIFSRGDEEVIDYIDSGANDACGCLMVKFGKHEGIDFTSVGMTEWFNSNRTVARLESGYTYEDFGRRYFRERELTFGQTKDYCRKAFQGFCVEIK
jgi:hypothetical protein